MKDAPIVGPETVRNLAADMRKRTFRDELAVSASADRAAVRRPRSARRKRSYIHVQSGELD